MRHINSSDSLGVNHHLQQINKRDSSALNEVTLRRTIRSNRPDYGYVHLGVNDASQGIPLIDTIKNFCSFKSFIDSLSGTCLIISLPLLTSDSLLNSRIVELRKVLTEFVDWFSAKGPRPDRMRKLRGNCNRNFAVNGVIKREYYHRDGIHLSEEGKRIILANLRHHIHLFSKTSNHDHRATSRSGNSSQPVRARPGSSTAR